MHLSQACLIQRSRIPKIYELLHRQSELNGGRNGELFPTHI
jgi:hypothetical protein